MIKKIEIVLNNSLDFYSLLATTVFSSPVKRPINIKKTFATKPFHVQTFCSSCEVFPGVPQIPNCLAIQFLSKIN